MDDYLIDIIKNNKVEAFTGELKEKYKQCICSRYQDILIYAIENTTSLEIISSIIKWYDTLNYTSFSQKINDYRTPLFVAIALNKFSFANLLIENKASKESINYAYEYLVNYGYINIENLSYMIDIGIPVGVGLLFSELKKLINDNDNDKNIISLEKYFKQFLINRNEDLDLSEFPIYSISIQTILYEVIKTGNYYLLEKSFEYCGNKEESLLNIIFKLFNGFKKYLHKNKKDAFINNIKNENLKNKIKNYFNEKELPDKRRKKILDIAKGGNLKELQQYIYDNKIELKSLNDDHFDILISAIVNKVPVKIVKYIINQCHYHSLDYYISIKDDFLKIHLNEGNRKNSISSIYMAFENNDFIIPSPVYTAIANNDFIISNLLLDYGADISYTKGYTNFNNNIITYLYKNKLLNFENLTYIINNGFDIYELYNKIITDFISNNYFDTTKEEDKKYYEYSNSFLEIFLKNVKEYNIEKDHYVHAVYNNNITALIILLHYDKNNKNDVLHNCNGLKHKILKQINNMKKFHECNFYYNINKKNGYIDEKTCLNLKSNINEFYLSFLEKREIIKNRIIKNIFFFTDEFFSNIRSYNFNVDGLKKFLIDINIAINELNTYDFDILIYAIENNASDEIIKYIIDQYKTLNYSIENKNDESYCKTITPLTVAINKEKFNIADYLLEKGARFNYDKIYDFLNKLNINKKSIEYLFSNNYFVSTENDSNEILKIIINRIKSKSPHDNNYIEYYYDDNHNYPLPRFDNSILEIYLKCSSIKEKKIKIDDSMYKRVIIDHNMKALLLLYEHDYRDKDIVSTIIYNESYNNTINYLNQLNDNEAKKLISKLEEIDIIHKQRNALLSLLRKNKSNLIKSKYLFEEFIKNNDIDIKKINTYSFDMLIYLIENNFSTEFIKYILSCFDYKTFDYVVKKKTPLMVCISKKRFEIADLLLEKGSDINYKGEWDYESFEFLDDDIVNIQTVKYLLRNGFTDSNYLINICYKQKELVEIVIQHYFYNKELITVLLNIYKMKKSLSVKELQKVLFDFANKIFNDDIYNKIYDEDVLNTFLKYEFDNRKRNKILFKFEISKEFNNDASDYYDYFDDNYINYYNEPQCSPSYSDYWE